MGTVGVLFLYVVEVVKIKKKRATRLSNNAVHDKNSFLKYMILDLIRIINIRILINQYTIILINFLKMLLK